MPKIKAIKELDYDDLILKMIALYCSGFTDALRDNNLGRNIPTKEFLQAYLNVKYKKRKKVK